MFLVSSYLESTFNKSTFDLRDKTILKIDREKVDRLEIETPDRTLKVAKQGADWRIASPVDARADFGAVEGHPRPAEHHADEGDRRRRGDGPEGVRPRQAGRDRARDVSGSSQAGLAIGKSAGEGVVYAKDLSRPMVFTVESALFDELKKPADDFRDQGSVRRAVVQHDAGRNRARRADDHASRRKRTRTPGSRSRRRPKAADTAKVEALLTALTSARATSLRADKIAGTGLETPELTVTLALRGRRRSRRRSPSRRKGTDAFARRDGDAAAAKIDATALDGIVKAIDA